MDRHKNLLNAQSAVVLVIDVQERFSSHIFQFDKIATKIATLVEAAALLEVPVIVTEQYKKGLGATVPVILERLAVGTKTFEKMCFSAASEPDFEEYLNKLDNGSRKQVIVCGIECHVCVNQTVLDLLQKGYEVHLVTDAIGSRDPENKKVGLAKMYGAGALPSSLEMCLFEMLVESGTERFKAVQKLVK